MADLENDARSHYRLQSTSAPSASSSRRMRLRSWQTAASLDSTTMCGTICRGFPISAIPSRSGTWFTWPTPGTSHCPELSVRYHISADGDRVRLVHPRGDTIDCRGVRADRFHHASGSRAIFSSISAAEPAGSLPTSCQTPAGRNRCHWAFPGHSTERSVSRLPGGAPAAP